MRCNVTKSLVFAVSCVLWASGCSGMLHQDANKFNHSTVLSRTLPYNPLRWSVVTSAVSRKDATVYTVFGNDEASSFARSGAGGNYPIDAIVSLVTWTQRPNPRWFGGMIPGAVRSVEFASVITGDGQRPEYVYEKFEGNPLQAVTSQKEAVTTGRLAYILAQRGALMP